MQTSIPSAAPFFKTRPLLSLSKGELIIRPDDTELPPITYIEEGLVMQYDISLSGKKSVVNIFKPGAFFPVGSAINDTPNAFFFEAMTDVTVRQANAASVKELLIENPDITYDLLSRLYRGIDGLLGKMSLLLDGTAEARVLYELMISGERFGEKDGNLTRIHITEAALSEQVGLTRETVSRSLKKLRATGAVSLERGVIILHPFTK